MKLFKIRFDIMKFFYRIRDIYQAEADLSHSETMMNELITRPSLKFALCAISGDTRGLGFFPREEQLLSMTKQLKNNNTQYDERLCYKSDAKTGGNMELVLLETSNSYDDTTNKKVNFDFHKGMFGTVAMLKTIADKYNYASFDSFKKLKLYFIHAHTKHLRLWSISCPVPNLFVINREDKCSIPVSFNDDTKNLFDYIGFMWTLKERIEETLLTIGVIELAHKEYMKEYRYKPLLSEMNLSNRVDPSIVEITERVHASYFVEDGPFSSPLGPPKMP
ncbi:hypothetical protein BDC45DRAFT_434229 [Circinella umbellata]|nr:hypothetical protein BDC45DRAFT_434229 [Circinella umbellata]